MDRCIEFLTGFGTFFGCISTIIAIHFLIPYHPTQPKPMTEEEIKERAELKRLKEKYECNAHPCDLNCGLG